MNSAKSVVHLVFTIALLAFAGCSDTPVDVNLSEQLYFDLKGYFGSEVQRLAKFQKVKKTIFFKVALVRVKIGSFSTISLKQKLCSS